MSWYPLFVRMDGRRALVVGGGEVACRKAGKLLEAGATVVAIGQDFSAGFAELAARYGDRLTLESGRYAPRDLSSFSLVVAATDDRIANEAVARDARRAGVWVNAVDSPELCTAQAAAVVRRGPLQVAIHTGGAYPALASVLREELESHFDEWYETYLGALARVREFVRSVPVDAARRRSVLRALADPALREQCRCLSQSALVERLTEEARRRLHVDTAR